MNDSTPFDTIGDGPLEARIVAWVLGEASAFEAAELGRLCDERPELEIFRRRLLALHGLLAEAATSGPDEAWKLPPEKRTPLDELFGVEQASVPAADPEVRIRRSGRRALWAIAACLVVSVVIAKFIGPIDPISPMKTAESQKPQSSPTTSDLTALNKAIREQEDKVEERRKVLSTIVRTKGIIYKGEDSFYGSSGVNEDQLASDKREESIRRGLDAQDYADAKRDFESDQQLLQAMKLKQIGLSGGRTDSSSDMAIVDQDSSSRMRASAVPPPPAAPARNAAAGSLASNEVTNDLRSGDQAINRNNIDAILNNPTRAAEAQAATAMNESDAAGRAAGWSSGVPEQKIKARSSFALSDESMQNADLGRELSVPATPIPAPAVAYLQSTVPIDESAPRLEKMPSLSRQSAAGSEALPSTGQVELDLQILAGGAQNPLQEVMEGESQSFAKQDRYAMTLAPAEPPIGMEPALESESQLAKNRDGIEIHAGKSSSYLFRAKDLRSPLESMEEITAAAEPYSTFSLNISDASFQIAKAALEKGERPDPASIKTEQFYNAVDYGDSSPAADEPVTAFVEQSGHPIIPGRNLVRVSLKTAAAGRAASQPLRLTLLVDQSGSMVREDRRAAMTNALKQLGGLLTPVDHINVVGFSRSPRLLADNLTGDQSAKLPDLVNQTASEGGTNLEEALKLGEEMAARHQAPGEQNHIVLFTDGAANLGNADPERLAIRIKALRQKGIAFDIAGIGADGLNDRLLGELARHGNGRYYVVDDKSDRFARQLAGAFRPAAENVKVQVRFNPERVGNYKLIGFEKDRLKTEDFRNDAVDAAELAAEEAGVAVYQVETLPEGTGEIGEVSVRFRDTAKGEMVERKWTMPFEPSTLPFDRATPSMQLAGLSMLAAEKLKGGPLADAIDFKPLAGPQATVKQFYPASPRVADMLRLIDALK